MKRLRRFVSEGSISMISSPSEESSLSASASSRGGVRFCCGRGRGLGRVGRVAGEEVVEGRGAGELAWVRGEGEGGARLRK